MDRNALCIEAGLPRNAAPPAPGLLEWLAARLAPWLDRLLERADRGLAPDRVWWLACAALIVLQVALIVRHQPWSDEWQALQIAIESPTYSDLLVNLRYEGHPLPWYALLRTLAALVPDPALALPLAAVLIALPLQATILIAAPFRRLDRLALSASEFILFEAMTLSRSLTLGVALMIAVAALWRRPRLVWLPLIALPQCDALFGVAAVVLVGLRWRDWRSAAPLFAAWVASGVFAAWTVRPMPDVVPALVPTGTLHDAAIWLANVSAIGLPLQWSKLAPVWNNPPPPVLGSVGLIGFAMMAWAELHRDRARLAALAAMAAVTLVFSMTVYHLSVRHLEIIALLLVVLVWQRAAAGHAPTRWFRGWLSICALCGLATAAINAAEPFDTAPEALATIRRMGLVDAAWTAFPANAGQSIAAISLIRFERLSGHCSQDFVRWNDPDIHRIDSYQAIEARLARKLAADGRFYLVSRFVLPDHPPLIRHIGAVKPGYDGQDFHFYVIGEGRPAARPHGVSCVAAQGPRDRG